MTQHQGIMEWGSHINSTPLYLDIVSLLCSVSVRITLQFVMPKVGITLEDKLKYVTLLDDHS
jgi:hypothetical protein